MLAVRHDDHDDEYSFVYTQLNVKTDLFQIVQFSVSTLSTSKTVLFQTILFSITSQFTWYYSGQEWSWEQYQ